VFDLFGWLGTPGVLAVAAVVGLARLGLRRDAAAGAATTATATVSGAFEVLEEGGGVDGSDVFAVLSDGLGRTLGGIGIPLR